VNSPWPANRCGYAGLAARQRFLTNVAVQTINSSFEHLLNLIPKNLYSADQFNVSLYLVAASTLHTVSFTDLHFYQTPSPSTKKEKKSSERQPEKPKQQSAGTPSKAATNKKAQVSLLESIGCNGTLNCLDKEQPNGNPEARPATFNEPAAAAVSEDAPSINDLRHKLQARIDSLRAVKGKSKADSPASSPLPSGREGLLEERREKMRAEAEDPARKAAKANKKRKARASELPPVEPQDKAEDVAEAQETVEDVPRPKKRRESEAPKPTTETTPAPASDADLAFSNLSFTTASVNPVDAPRRKKIVNGKKVGSTAEAALERIQSRQKFLSHLTPQSRERAEEKAAWEGASKRAEGQKVLDNEVKLKKVLKRKEKEKDKSRKLWYVDFSSLFIHYRCSKSVVTGLSERALPPTSKNRDKRSATRISQRGSRPGRTRSWGSSPRRPKLPKLGLDSRVAVSSRRARRVGERMQNVLVGVTTDRQRRARSARGAIDRISLVFTVSFLIPA
jgi:hypothetical protein